MLIFRLLLTSCRISEKFLDWSDEDPSLDFILADVSLYWFTETMPRCLYPYRGDSGDEERPRIAKTAVVSDCLQASV